MSVTLMGPTQHQIGAWTKELEGLQLSINTSSMIDSKVYVKSMLNIMVDLVESFKEPIPVCRKCGRHLASGTEAWDHLCQSCFDEIIGKRLA